MPNHLVFFCGNCLKRSRPRSREINAGLADAQVRMRLANVGRMVTPGTPADFRKVAADETEKWGSVVRVANIKRSEAHTRNPSRNEADRKQSHFHPTAGPTS
jgi:hypothetical protein